MILPSGPYSTLGLVQKSSVILFRRERAKLSSTWHHRTGCSRTSLTLNDNWSWTRSTNEISVLLTIQCIYVRLKTERNLANCALIRQSNSLRCA